MTWTVQFVVYRLDTDMTLLEVYHPKDLPAAKYWLKYIALPGDVCCRTPAHPKHSKAGLHPEYFCHKDSSGKTSDNSKQWWEYIRAKGFAGDFPEEQLAEEIDGV